MRIVIKDCSDVWRILYSTQNIRIAHKPEILPKNLIMSAVVFQELVAGAADRTELKRLQSVGKQYEKENKLLVPTGEDYFRAGKIMNSLLHNLKTQAGGKIPRLHPNRIQKMFRDTLIAVSVHRVHALLVTDNLKDFEAIRRYCKVRLRSGADFFGT
jgi:predicted nucleic acid-binding protein